MAADPDIASGKERHHVVRINHSPLADGSGAGYHYGSVAVNLLVYGKVPAHIEQGSVQIHLSVDDYVLVFLCPVETGECCISIPTVQCFHPVPVVEGIVVAQIQLPDTDRILVTANLTQYPDGIARIIRHLTGSLHISCYGALTAQLN